MLTQSISDQLAIPFEKEKVSKNYFSGQIALEEGDPSLEAYKRICSTASRISQKYHGHFSITKGSRRQCASANITYGKSTIIGGLPEALAQNLQMSVTHLNQCVCDYWRKCE